MILSESYTLAMMGYLFFVKYIMLCSTVSLEKAFLYFGNRLVSSHSSIHTSLVSLILDILEVFREEEVLPGYRLLIRRILWL